MPPYTRRIKVYGTTSWQCQTSESQTHAGILNRACYHRVPKVKWQCLHTWIIDWNLNEAVHVSLQGDPILAWHGLVELSSRGTPFAAGTALKTTDVSISVCRVTQYAALYTQDKGLWNYFLAMPDF